MHEEGEPRPDHGVGRGLTHASFFSGVGGLDLGLERGSWETVVFHEIDAYASAVLGTRWPAIPNGGCIYQALGAPPHVHGEKYECLDPVTGRKTDWPGLFEGGDAAGAGRDDPGGGGRVGAGSRASGRRRGIEQGSDGVDWAGADLFTGGFPCQDLSIAGKRKGLAGHRSGLAYAFLALVERHQPRALLLENVPGLLSSHRGRDFGALLRLMGELGYGVAYRVLDARYFGVPQRRKRVFILGLRSGPDDPDGRAAAERAAAVLAVGTRCPWHPPTGTEAGPVPPGRPGGGPERYGVDYVGAWQAGPHGHHGYDQASVQGHLPVISHALTAQHTTGRLDPNGETFVVAGGRERGGGDAAGLRPRLAGPAQHDEQRVDEPDGAPADPGGDGAPDGLARRLDDRARLEGADGGGPPSAEVLSPTLQVGPARPADDGPGDTVPVIVQRPFVKISRARAVDGEGERWDEENLSPTLNTFDMGDARAVTLIAQPRILDRYHPSGAENDLSPTLRAGQPNSEGGGSGAIVPLIAQEVAHTVLGKPNSSHAADMDTDTYVVAATPNSGGNDGGFRTEPGEHLVVAGTIREHVRPGSNTDHSVITPLVESVADPLLPEGLDSHRYRCCGNGVVSHCAEWIGNRLAAELRDGR